MAFLSCAVFFVIVIFFGLLKSDDFEYSTITESAYLAPSAVYCFGNDTFNLIVVFSSHQGEKLSGSGGLTV